MGSFLVPGTQTVALQKCCRTIANSLALNLALFVPPVLSWVERTLCVRIPKRQWTGRARIQGKAAVKPLYRSWGFQCSERYQFLLQRRVINTQTAKAIFFVGLSISPTLELLLEKELHLFSWEQLDSMNKEVRSWFKKCWAALYGKANRARFTLGVWGRRKEWPRVVMRPSQGGTHLCQHCLAVTNIFLFKGNRPPIVRWQVAEVMTCFQHSNWSFEQEHANYIASWFRPSSVPLKPV